jgi:His-Xaa-Ser system protein HxsD
MDAIRIDVDVGMFSLDVIARAAHRYTGEFFVDIALSPPPARVAFTLKHADTDVELLALRFGNDLLDERLRAYIREETADLHTILTQAALREASPRYVEAIL